METTSLKSPLIKSHFPKATDDPFTQGGFIDVVLFLFVLILGIEPKALHRPVKNTPPRSHASGPESWFLHLGLNRTLGWCFQDCLA